MVIGEGELDPVIVAPGEPSEVMASDSSDSLSRGAMVGRYVIADILGQGGMGVVYSAFDAQLGRRLAIKFLRDDRLRTNPALAPRLLREAQAMARLTHPNVVSIYDVGTHGARVFLVMEYVEGSTLGVWLESERPWRTRLGALLAAGEGLAAAHDAGVIHRDFKPDNVLIGTGNRVVVMDFGLAREADQDTMSIAAIAVARDIEGGAAPPPSPLKQAPDPLSGTPFSAALTLEGSVLGTVGFMAPEQAYGQPTSVATDQFSYCVTAYLALYGKRPFAGETVGEYLRSIFRTPPEEPPGTKIPSWVRKVLLKGMSRKPENRYRSMRELLSALRNDPRVRMRHWALGMIAAIATCAATSFGFRAFEDRRHVCASDPKEWSSVWDDESRAEARRAFIAADGVHGGETFERAAVPIDAYVTQWNAMQTEACNAARVDKRQTQEVYRLRTDCLARRKMDLKSATRLMRQADKQVVSKAISLAYNLESISWCGDVEALRSSAGLPDDPLKRAKVIEVRGKLADARSRRLGGKLTEAEHLAMDAVALARAVGHDTTTAETLLNAAEAVMLQGEYARSVPLFREAFFIAAGAGADALVVRAASTLGFVTGPKLQHGEEARTWLDTGHAALRRLGGNEELELDLMGSEAGFYNEVEWRPDLAVPLHEKAVATYRRLLGVHPNTAMSLYRLGVTYSYLGDPVRARTALEESRSMYESLGGPRYFEVGRSEYMLGQTVATLGEFGWGESLIHRAIEIFDENGMDYWSALAFGGLAWSALARGDVATAVKSADKALAALTKAKSPTVLVPIINVMSGRALVRGGRAKEALALCDRAVQEQEKSKAIYAEKVYGWDALACKSEALMALGRAAEAVPYLERSLTLNRRMFPGDHALVEFALSRALFFGPNPPQENKQRATELASRARDELGKYPFLAVDAAELDTWMARLAKAGK